MWEREGGKNRGGWGARKEVVRLCERGFEALLVWIGDEDLGGSILKLLGFEGTVFLDPGSSRSDPEMVEKLGVDPTKLELATVGLGREEGDFATGLFWQIAGKLGEA